METEQFDAFRPHAVCSPGVPGLFVLDRMQASVMERSKGHYRDKANTGKSNFRPCREKHCKEGQMKEILQKFGMCTSIHLSQKCLLKARVGDSTHWRTPVFMECMLGEAGDKKSFKTQSILFSDKYQRRGKEKREHMLSRFEFES